MGAADSTALVDILVGLLEYRHPFFRGSSSLARLVALAIGREMQLGHPELEALALTALLRDLGRVAVGGDLLSRPRMELEPVAKQKIEAHVENGLALLEGTTLPAGVREAIRHHHERFDGAGYPDGIAGEDIPLLARIVAVADSFAAMVAPRAYRLPRQIPAVIEELREEAGKRYDPVVVEALIRSLEGRERARFAFGLRHHLIIVHPDEVQATVTASRLCRHGYLAEVAEGLTAAKDRLQRVPAQAVVLATGDSGEQEMVDFITELREDRHLANLAIVTVGADSMEQRVGLLQAGANICLPGNATFEELRGTIGALVGRAAKRAARDTPSGATGAASGTAAGEGDNGESWYALQGDVRKFPLPWLLQVLQYDTRTGAVAVSTHGNEGFVYLENGRPCHAKTRNTEGEEALREILGWKEARFRVHPDVKPPAQTIQSQLMHILLDEAVAEDHAGIFGTAHAE